MVKVATPSESIDIKRIKRISTYAKLIDKTPQMVGNYIREKKVDTVIIDGKCFVIV